MAADTLALLTFVAADDLDLTQTIMLTLEGLQTSGALLALLCARAMSIRPHRHSVLYSSSASVLAALSWQECDQDGSLHGAAQGRQPGVVLCAENVR